MVKKLDEAKTILSSCICEAEKVYGQQHPNVLNLSILLGSALTKLGKYEQGQTQLK